MSSLSTLDLFDNPTRSLISWNLLIHKELSASQLKTMLGNTSLSTITRNLSKMEEKGIIYQSRVEMLKNLETKYWKLNSEIFEEDPAINPELLHSLDEDEKDLFIERTSNMISLFFGFVRTMLEPENFDIRKILTQPEQEHPSLTISIMKEKTGDVFRKDFRKYLQNFMEKEEEEFGSKITDINLDSHLVFIFTSKIKSLIPSINDN